MGIFVESAYASAWKHLRDARIAERNALIFGLDVYKAGERGARARTMRRFWAKRRALFLEKALQVRSNIRELRATYRALETNDEAPRSAAE